jgi:Leucine-rich repeat (LRR) protein/PKD repeat protein
MKTKLIHVLSTCVLISCATSVFASDTKLPEGNVPDAVELAVLEDIFTTMGGSSWTNKTNWPTSWPATATSVDYATWFGITVTNNDITAIILPTNGLTGSIPSSVGDLAELTYVNLSVNSITAIPTSIGDLSKLYYLALPNNQITSIPAEIGDATALLELYLHVNQITNLPGSITNMVHLKTLSLFQNQITGTLPTDIGDMTALETFSVGQNDMSGTIPTSIGDMAVLRSLDLSNNDFTGSIPTSIGNMTALLWLALAANDLTGPIPSEIGSLTNLTQLSLNMNQLSGSIPSQIGNLTKLQYINFDSNGFTGPIPSTFSNLIKLETIEMRLNQLGGPLPDFGNMKVLRGLYLENNQITGTIPSSLSGATSLISLSLGGNLLTGNIPSSLGNLASLTSLGLNSAYLSGSIPTSLANLSGLYLYAAQNNFTFSDVLPYVAINNKVQFDQQRDIDVERTINLPLGNTLHLVAAIDRSTTPACTYRWIKKVGSGYSVINEFSTGGHTVDITGLTLADDGAQYFYQVMNSEVAVQLSSKLITVHVITCPTVAADFETSVDSYTYTFTPTVTGADSCTKSYLWDFGDGQTSPDATSSHVFNTAGTYLVSLTMSYTCGECDSTAIVVQDTVEVSNTSICTAIYCDGYGNVGIGTMHTQGFRLSVDGKIRASEIIKVYPQGQWSDFVFEDKYRLRPLSEVEQFIKVNGHLPDIPSAKEVEKDGVELGSMDAKLLQKIEELTLYVIELKKENESMKTDIKRLKNEK